jgi:hypothetical protein
LRDDRQRLQAIAAFAAAWYGRERAGITFSLQRIDPFAGLGTLIDATVTAGVQRSVGTCITSIGFDYTRKPRTTIQTGYSEIDFNVGMPHQATMAGMTDQGDEDTGNAAMNDRRHFHHGKSPFGED